MNLEIMRKTFYLHCILPPFFKIDNSSLYVVLDHCIVFWYIDGDNSCFIIGLYPNKYKINWRYHKAQLDVKCLFTVLSLPVIIMLWMLIVACRWVKPRSQLGIINALICPSYLHVDNIWIYQPDNSFSAGRQRFKSLHPYGSSLLTIALFPLYPTPSDRYIFR